MPSRLAASGLRYPAPVAFPGGISDMPAGSHACLDADLAPGACAFSAGKPAPREAGFVLRFSIE